MICTFHAAWQNGKWQKNNKKNLKLTFSPIAITFRFNEMK